MADDFTNHPKSITELRSDRTNGAKDWTPRDVLIDVLRAIDEGRLDPDALMVIIRPRAIKPHHVAHVGYRVSSPDFHTTLGMVASALHKVQMTD